MVEGKSLIVFVLYLHFKSRFQSTSNPGTAETCRIIKMSFPFFSPAGKLFLHLSSIAIAPCFAYDSPLTFSQMKSMLKGFFLCSLVVM